MLLLNRCNVIHPLPLCGPFRRLCLQRWSFCNLAVLGSEHVTHSWKRYFLRRSHLEMKMTKGQSGGYTCKSLRGHTGRRGVVRNVLCVSQLCLSSNFNIYLCICLPGRVTGLVYLKGNSAQHPDLWNHSGTVCSASSDGTVRAWNIQNVSAS